MFNPCVAGMAWRTAVGRAAAQDAAGSLPLRRNDLLASERAGRQRQEQRPQPHRASCSGELISPSQDYCDALL
jgi:hypothetical protein